MQNLTLLLAFGAGVLSFASPCVLPLVPAYVGHLAGRSLHGKELAGRGATLAHAAAFVLGFSAIFVVLGVSVGLVGFLIRDQLVWFRWVAGAALVAMGLHMAGLLRIRRLYGERRFHWRPNPRWGLASSFLVGAFFGAGWTPCIGPVLGAILTVATVGGSATAAASLLLTYSLGLGVPFLITGYALDTVSVYLRRLNRHAGLIEKVSGGLVAAMGVAVALNWFGFLASLFPTTAFG